MAEAGNWNITVENKSYRPCMVGGDKEALFHDWIFEDEVFINFNGVVKPYEMRRIAKSVREYGVVPNMAYTTPVKKTYGLVEFRDGTIQKVNPLDIRFLDSDEKFEKEDAAFWRDYDRRMEGE
jgi:hypothetical protein